MMSSSRRSTDDQRSSRVKLRAACNQCHDSKIRCSGERFGCNRCQTLGCECIYEESRVGKVQGNRGRRRKTRLETEQQQQATTAPEENQNTRKAPESRDGRESSSLSEAVTPLDHDVSSMEDEQTLNRLQGDNAPAHWTEPMNTAFSTDLLTTAGSEDCSFFAGIEEFPGRDALHAASQHQSPRAVLDQPTLNDFPALLSADIPDTYTLLDPASGETRGGVQQRSSSTQLHTYYDKSSISTDSMMPPEGSNQWLYECVRMADELERYIHIRLSAVDEVMRINRQTINKINNMLHFEELTPSVSLLGLACMTLSHVVTLYELAAEALESKGNLPGNTTSFSSFGNLNCRPTIRFGNFYLDTEGQQAVQEQIFLKELQRCSRAAVKLSNRLGFDHADGGRLRSLYSSWQSEIVTRVEKVQSDIGKDEDVMGRV